MKHSSNHHLFVAVSSQHFLPSVVDCQDRFLLARRASQIICVFLEKVIKQLETPEVLLSEIKSCDVIHFENEMPKVSPYWVTLPFLVSFKSSIPIYVLSEVIFKPEQKLVYSSKYFLSPFMKMYHVGKNQFRNLHFGCSSLPSQVS